MASAPFALILAGGSGTRFWPLSRNARPKQLLNLFDDRTLLEQTMDRLEGLVPKENILILTNVEQVDAVRSILHGLPAENIVAEPAKRDTAPAVSLAVGWVRARDPEGVMIVLPADQLIQDVAGFQRVMRAAVEAASLEKALVTIGIRPTWPCPSYGYIERGEQAGLPGMESEMPVYEVARFREKPSPELAKTFLEKGTFSWNAGMFIWSVATVREELGAHSPQLAHFVDEVAQSADLAATLDAKFGSLPKISIDYALMENASRVLNIEAAFDWDDVGSWISVAKYLRKDADENSLNCEISEIDSQNNIVYSKADGHIALLGVNDLIVVQTKDALLIASRHQADRIKQIADIVPEELQ